MQAKLNHMLLTHFFVDLVSVRRVSSNVVNIDVMIFSICLSVRSILGTDEKGLISVISQGIFMSGLE